MSMLTADDWKAEGKWEEYKLMVESVHHVTPQMKKQKEKKKACTRDKKKGAEW